MGHQRYQEVDHEWHLRRLLHRGLQNRRKFELYIPAISALITPQKGLTVILIPRDDNIETKAIKTAYSSTAGTAYVTFTNVRVPVSHTLGQVNKGLQVILSNFNHERWMICGTSLGAQRRIVEECLKWSNQRIVFGKPLNSQAVIRAKLANMIARIESAQNWLESITHQMNNVRTPFPDIHIQVYLICFLFIDVVRYAVGQTSRANRFAETVRIPSVLCFLISSCIVISIPMDISSRCTGSSHALDARPQKMQHKCSAAAVLRLQVWANLWRT